MSPKASLDVLEMRKISCPYLDLNPKSSSPLPSYYTTLTTLSPKGEKVNTRIMVRNKDCKFKLHVFKQCFGVTELTNTPSWTRYCSRHAEAPKPELVIQLHLSCCIW